MGGTGSADGVGCLSVPFLLSPSIPLPLCWLLTPWHHRLSTALSPSSWALQGSCWFPISLRNQSMSLLLFFFIFLHLVGSHWPSRPLFPPEPHSPWSFYLRPSHIALARSRAAKFRRADNKKFTFASVKKAVMGPLFYCFVILYVASVLGQGGYNCTSLRSVSSLPHFSCSFSDGDANHLTPHAHPRRFQSLAQESHKPRWYTPMVRSADQRNPNWR